MGVEFIPVRWDVLGKNGALAGLTEAESDIVRYIHDNPLCRPGELSEHFGINYPTVHYYIQQVRRKLAKVGVKVERIVSPQPKGVKAPPYIRYEVRVDD